RTATAVSECPQSLANRRDLGRKARLRDQRCLRRKIRRVELRDFLSIANEQISTTSLASLYHRPLRPRRLGPHLWRFRAGVAAGAGVASGSDGGCLCLRRADDLAWRWVVSPGNSGLVSADSFSLSHAVGAAESARRFGRAENGSHIPRYRRTDSAALGRL